MLRMPHITLAAAALVAAVDAQDRDYPIYLTSDALLDMKAVVAGQDDAIRDIVVDPSGQLTTVLFDSGAVGTYEDLVWQPGERAFALRAGGGAEDPSDQTTPRERDRALLLTKILGLPIHGPATADDATHEELGSVGGTFVEAHSGRLAFVTTSVGGVLGVGAESKVLPFDALEIERLADGGFIFTTSFTKERLERAPTLGEDVDQVDNPPYRDSVYSYFGVDRPDSDPRRDTDDRRDVLTLAKLIGADVSKGDGRTDTVENLILDPEKGTVSEALLASGVVVPIGELRWNHAEERFALGTSGAETPKSGEAARTSGRRLLATALSDMRVLSREGEHVSGVQDVYFDTNSGELAYVTVDHDGVRVLPWSLVDVRGTARQELTVKLPKALMADAPELDGTVGASIYSPAFRSRVAKLEDEQRDQ